LTGKSLSNEQFGCTTLSQTTKLNGKRNVTNNQHRRDDTIIPPCKVIHLIVQHNVGEDLSYR